MQVYASGVNFKFSQYRLQFLILYGSRVKMQQIFLPLLHRPALMYSDLSTFVYEQTVKVM